MCDTVILDLATGVKLSWRNNSFEGLYDFELTAPTTGWIAIAVRKGGEPHTGSYDAFAGWASSGLYSMTSGVMDYQLAESLGLNGHQLMPTATTSFSNVSGAVVSGATALRFTAPETLVTCGPASLPCDRYYDVDWAYAAAVSLGTKHAAAGTARGRNLLPPSLALQSGLCNQVAPGGWPKTAGGGLVLTVGSCLLFAALLRFLQRAYDSFLIRSRRREYHTSSSTHSPSPHPPRSWSTLRSAARTTSRFKASLSETQERMRTRHVSAVMKAAMKRRTTFTTPAKVSGASRAMAGTKVRLQRRIEVSAELCGLQLKGCVLELSMAQLLVALAYVATNLGWVWWWAQPHWLTQNAIGHLASANALALVLPATKHSLLMLFFDLPFDAVVQYHRWLGYLVIALVHAHTYWYWASWAGDGGYTTWRKMQFDVSSTRVSGFVAYAATLALLVTSIDWMRRKHYCTFLLSHHALYLLFYVGALLHTPHFRPYARALAPWRPKAPDESHRAGNARWLCRVPHDASCASHAARRFTCWRARAHLTHCMPNSDALQLTLQLFTCGDDARSRGRRTLWRRQFAADEQAPARPAYD